MHRRAIVILGPHRSGTSALAGAIAKLGAAVSARLMPPKPDNPLRAYDGLDNVDILGSCRPEQLPDLLEVADCDAAPFQSMLPATYSYTMTEAWRAGLIPITMPLGAQTERVRTLSFGFVLPEESIAQDVLRAILKIRAHAGETRAAQKMGGDYRDLLPAYYGLRAKAEKSAPAAELCLGGAKKRAKRKQASAK